MLQRHYSGEAKTSCFFVFITRHLPSTVRVRAIGCHLYFHFARDPCKQNEALEESCRCLENSLSAICGSKWLTGILEYSRLLLYHLHVYGLLLHEPDRFSA